MPPWCDPGFLRFGIDPGIASARIARPFGWHPGGLCPWSVRFTFSFFGSETILSHNLVVDIIRHIGPFPGCAKTHFHGFVELLRLPPGPTEVWPANSVGGATMAGHHRPLPWAWQFVLPTIGGALDGILGFVYHHGALVLLLCIPCHQARWVESSGRGVGSAKQS